MTTKNAVRRPIKNQRTATVIPIIPRDRESNKYPRDEIFKHRFLHFVANAKGQAFADAVQLFLP